MLAPARVLGAPVRAAMLLVAAVSLHTGLPVTVVRKQGESNAPLRSKGTSLPARSPPCRGRDHHRNQVRRAPKP